MWYFLPNHAAEIDFKAGFKFLDTELQKLILDNLSPHRHADKLIRMWLKEELEVWFLVHVEAQRYQDSMFATGMAEYIYRIRDNYQIG